MYIFNVLLYPIFDFFKTKSQIWFKFCVDVSCVDSYQVCKNLGSTPCAMGFWVIFSNFLSITKISYSSRPLTRHHSYIWFGKFPVALFLVYSVPIFTLWINDLCLTHFDRLLNRCTDLLQIWCWCFFGRPLPDLFKFKLLPLFWMELLVILCIFSNS